MVVPVIQPHGREQLSRYTLGFRSDGPEFDDGFNHLLPELEQTP